MSTIRVDNFSPSAGGTTYSARGIAKAWVYVQPNTILDSLNVSSLTDVGTGMFQYNFASTFSSANYSTTASKQNSSSNDSSVSLVAGQSDASVVRVFYYEHSGQLWDPAITATTVHGDLA